MLEAEVRSILTAVRDSAAEKGITATISLHREKSHLMRIGNNSVSLNTSETLTRLDVEVTNGRRQGTHTHLGQIESAAVVQRALDTAVQKAQVAKEKDYEPLVAAVEENIDESMQYDEALAILDPLVKADAYGTIIRDVGESYNYSGSWSSGVTEQYVVTTANANEAWHLGTDQRFNAVLKHADRRWELSHTETGWRASDFSVSETVEHFKSLLPVFEGKGGFYVKPADYTVLFGSEAIAGILGMAMYTGLTGRAWEEKLGWTAHNKPGDLILGRNVTLVDDPGNDNTFRFGFDSNGRMRERMPLVESGALVRLMYDASTAAKYGKEATGHDTGSTSLVMSPGDGPADPLEATRGMGRVLYIPALHYMHIPNRSEGVFTGSSRFNAVLVEDGRIVQPIFSSRITDTFRNVLSNVKVISREAVSVNESDTYSRRAPVAMSVPSYMIAEGVKITDCADSF